MKRKVEGTEERGRWGDVSCRAEGPGGRWRRVERRLLGVSPNVTGRKEEGVETEVEMYFCIRELEGVPAQGFSLLCEVRGKAICDE